MRKIIRYSEQFKLNVVRQVEQGGMSIAECRRKYGISGEQTVQNWLKKYGKRHLLNKVVVIRTPEEEDELERLRKENEKLREQLKSVQ